MKTITHFSDSLLVTHYLSRQSSWKNFLLCETMYFSYCLSQLSHSVRLSATKALLLITVTHQILFFSSWYPAYFIGGELLVVEKSNELIMIINKNYSKEIYSKVLRTLSQNKLRAGFPEFSLNLPK